MNHWDIEPVSEKLLAFRIKRNGRQLCAHEAADLHYCGGAAWTRTELEALVDALDLARLVWLAHDEEEART